MSELSKNQCCTGTDQSWSYIVAVIDIPCYFRAKSRGSVFDQNNMEKSMAAPIGHYNIVFWKVRTTSGDVLERKSNFFAGPLNFLNKPLFWLGVTNY